MRPVQAANMRAWAVLVKACERIKPGFVIIDTQARVTVGLKENDATDMGIFVAAVAAIKMATGAAVMPLHHTGRNGQDARGSSALDGAQDTELKVVALPQPLCGELRMDKQKDLAEGRPIPLRFRVHTVGVDEDGEPVTSLALMSADAWREAASEQPDVLEPGQETRVPEPEPWVFVVFGHIHQHTQRRILTVLETVAGEIGVTEASAQKVLLARWFDGRPMRAKRAEHLDPATWQKAWTDALAARTANGEPLVIKPNEHAARYAINPVAVSELSR
jgi:hypothetical protein